MIKSTEIEKTKNIHFPLYFGCDDVLHEENGMKQHAIQFRTGFLVQLVPCLNATMCPVLFLLAFLYRKWA